MTATIENKLAHPGFHKRPSRHRRGTAAVELAICMPMLALLVFGSIQACNLIFMKHAITSAAYEGTMELIRPSATNESVISRVDQVLAMHDLTQVDIAILPKGTKVEKLQPGSPVEIQVTANVKANLALSGWFPTAETLQYTVVSPR